MFSRLIVIILLGFIILPVFSQTTKTVKQPSQKQISSQNEIKTVSISTQTQSLNNNVKISENNTSVSNTILDDEKSEVLIDWGMSGNTSGSSDTTDEDGIPYSFGTFKGIFQMDGKSLLVFEGDDGTISFVQVLKQGEFIRWKVYFQIRRI